VRITFIGGGVMAEAMLSRALAERIVVNEDVCVAEPLADRRDYLARTHNVTVTPSNAEATKGSGLIIVAVKPQQFISMAQEISGILDKTQTVLSIVAGLAVTTITKALKHKAVIRVMPNTPAQIGAGMSVWTATSDVPTVARGAAQALLGVLGKEWYVEDEHYLDMATALSGSGPAYVFAFIESLIEAGVYLGMPRDMAHTTALQTVLGSAQLASDTGENPALLRARVTSPGGTTAEALRALEARGFRATILEAVVAAHRKARELGGQA
jgi:pyrroline-5-carboxylate reductase